MNKANVFLFLLLLISNTNIFAQSSGLVDCDEDLNEILSNANVKNGTVELCNVSGTSDVLVATLKDGKLTGVNTKSATGGGKSCIMRPTTGPTMPPKAPPKNPSDPNGSTAKKKGSTKSTTGTSSTVKSNKKCYQVTYVYRDGTQKTVILCDAI